MAAAAPTGLQLYICWVVRRLADPPCALMLDIKNAGTCMKMGWEGMNTKWDLHKVFTEQVVAHEDLEDDILACLLN